MTRIALVILLSLTWTSALAEEIAPTAIMLYVCQDGTLNIEACPNGNSPVLIDIIGMNDDEWDTPEERAAIVSEQFGNDLPK